MRPTCLALLTAALTVIGADAVAPADEKKVVRRVWFPRFSPDGKAVLAAHGGWEKNQGGEARLYAAQDGAVEHVFPHPRGVRTVAWSPKGTVFVTGAYGAGIRGFDVKARKELFHLAATQSVENVRITSDDKFIVATFGNGDLRLYDLASRKEVHTIPAVHDGGVWGMAVSPNDALVATGGKDAFVQVFDLGARKKLHSLKHPSEVNGLAFTPDGKYLATGCLDSRIRVFDVKTGERVALFQGHAGNTVTDLQFTSDGKILASSGADGTVRVWDVSDLKNPSQVRVLKAHAGLAFGVAISPDDRWVVSAGWDEQVRMWDLKTGDAVWTRKRD